MKIIIAPDKFKGSLTSVEVCKAITEGITQKNKNAEILHFPMADGGDGFNSVLQHYFHTTPVLVNTVDPLQRPMQASYQWNEHDRIAIIEMATASGLVLLKENERNPLLTSTYGTGLLIRHALERGADRVILGLGGSATNDAGIGILFALGFHFIDETGEELLPVGESLLKIDRIIPPVSLPLVRIEIAADVENPLYGTNGAAYVYGPQKGADPAMVAQLDRGLRNISAVIEKQFGKQIAGFPGAGAAGGIAAGLSAFFEVEMKKGVELVLQANGLEKELNNANLVITGEGKIDGQSGLGKVVGTMAALARKYKIPCIAFCGILEADNDEITDMGLASVYPLEAKGLSLEESMAKAYPLLVAKTIVAMENMQP